MTQSYLSNTSLMQTKCPRRLILQESLFLDDKDPGSIEKGGRGYVWRSLPRNVKQILGWHAFCYHVPSCVWLRSNPRSHKSRDTWKSKAKARRQSRPCLHPPHRLKPFAFHAMQNTGGLSETQMNMYTIPWLVTITGPIYILYLNIVTVATCVRLQDVCLLFIYLLTYLVLL